MKPNRNLYKALCSFAIIAMLFSCNSSKDEKFSKLRWNEQTDSAFPPPARPKIVGDLISNHKLVGLRYKELVALLGLPDQSNSNSIIYQISVDYGNDIDPIYTKDLVFTFSKDSLITKYKFDEWRK